VLAQAELDTPLVVLGRSISSAHQVADALRQADWQVLDRLAALDGPDAGSIRRTLRTAAAADENAAALRDALAKARDRTLALLVVPDPPKPAPKPPPMPPPMPTTTSIRGRRDDVLARLRDALGVDDRVEVTYRLLGSADDDR
jgi:nucleotide-binding universal stress UspA family protein